jgi:hypothetical protein
MNYQTNPSWRSILAVPLTLLPFSAQSELIGYFKLDGNFDDSSGNGNTGELFGGASYIAESPAVMGGGQSVVFDGQPGTYGAINSSPKEGLAITAQPFHSVSMWVKADGLQNQDKRIFSEARADSNDPLFNVGTANNANNGTVDIYIRNGGSLNHPRSIGEAFDGTWHHVAWTAQGKVMDLYIDGVFDSQFDYNAINDFIPTTTTIGGILRGSDCCNYFGNIDEVAIWDSILSADDIASLAEGISADELTGVKPNLDLDDDGLPNTWEVENGLDPNDNGSVDPKNGADGDPDNDQLSNADEFANGSDPNDSDTDSDEVNDAQEIALGTDILDPDSDGDGLLDGDEVTRGTNPLEADTDGDGITDNGEVLAGTDPKDPNSFPSEDDTLAAYWPLDSTDGTTTPDLGPYGYDLELRNMDATNFVTSEGRAAVSFDGIEDFLVRKSEANDILPISKNGSFTISMWIKAAGTGQNDRRFFSESSEINNNPLFNIGTRNNGSDNTVDIYLRDGGSPNHQFSTTEPFDDTWHHIAYTHDDTTMTIQLYVDGVLDRDDWTFKDVISPDVNYTTIGAILRANPSHWAQGLVDEVSLWSSVLPATTIAELASGATPIEVTGGGTIFGITSVDRKENGNISLTWNSRPSTAYVLEASLDLATWVEIDDGVQSQGEETTYVFPSGVPGLDTDIEHRIFFRIRK